KDAFHRRIVTGEDGTNPALVGTKAAIHYRFEAVPPGGSVMLRMRLTAAQSPEAPLEGIEALIARRREEADEFFGHIHPPGASDDERNIQRQALAGLLWTKMCYLFDVDAWLDGDDPDDPPPPSRQTIRNQHWKHLNSMRVLAVPDKWEYPWFAAW